ncbi:type II toxin-antitoxin system RelE/ParE family toxin [Rhizobium mongolense]|uniref:Plasmid stabilization system protein ParE n=2 Tax=Rhizobium mongolense TaxID=57676 RepID=A0A559TGW2_9HYPH|nr:type II toxin-antitoxin system RelE/ParE family toxin [Rhizobium mongolense]TVZ73836.1 plasmid stabilization system protein ParE [Rhizobium mongolense USDA 1844]
MAHRIEFREAAVEDLKALYLHIASESGRERAGAYIGRIEATCMSLATFPERGTVRAHIHPDLRIIGFEHSASIGFIVHDGIVDILRTLPKGMNFPDD